MKIQELLMNIHNKEFNIEKELQIKKYLPVLKKKEFVMNIISECTDDIDDFITVDRFRMNICFCMYALSAYTNLEIANNFDELIVQYDKLCESGILAVIIQLIKNDYDMLHTILDNELYGLLIQNSIDAQVVKVANKINKAIDMLVNKIDDVNINDFLPEGINLNDIVEKINLLK